MASTISDKLIPTDLEHELKKSFISYAMAVIISRALPDVRDGLKPVHRRILYAMNELGMTPDKPYRKSARIVGDVLGKYHPHGDSSVYDAMVRLAQDFNIRYPLVDGQGNFGSVDGDGAAAMRYTEARMSKLTLSLLGEIDKDTVDFYPNFDETLLQPSVLPCRYPNLLVNGSNGIAVGMATNIPPHNLRETVDACIYMIDHPDCTVDDLMQFIKGPDFPTGGIILGMAGVRAAYHTGRGRILVRARTEIEAMSQNRSRIVVTEIPYMVNKAKLVERIAELVAGVAEGCVQAGCALVGGETAEMPGFYPEDEYDLAGFTVGAVDKSKILDNSTMQPGDVIIALPSTGVHSNGFSLVRKIFDLENNPDVLKKTFDGMDKTLGEALLAPTKIYVKPVLAVMKEVTVKGVSHITGGGFYENIPRSLKAGCCAVIKKSDVRTPVLFDVLAKEGNIPERDMFNTFNMGVGMILTVAAEDADKAIEILKANGEDAYRLGVIGEGSGVQLV